MNFNLNEKKAIAKVLLEIVAADGKVHDAEIGFMERYQKLMKLTYEEIIDSGNMNVARCFSILRGFSVEKKETVSMLMAKLINVDGHIDIEELEVFYAVLEGAQIPVPKLN